MKYEPVFGDQSLFDGMMDDCEFIVGTYGYKIKDGKCFYCEKYNQKYGWAQTGDAAKALSPVTAMRRIISEPKRWTVADQKAGRLPEYGANVLIVVDGETEAENQVFEFKSGKWSSGGFFESNKDDGRYYYVREVKYWMPLPAAPEQNK